ncbi:hypothetical protein Tco_0700620 [Tanacetum coccineum]
MGDANPIRTLENYSKPSHEGYKNTIELPVGNNVVPLRSDTIRLVQNGCSFYELQSEDPNQYLKDFLKLVDSLDLDLENQVQRLMKAHLAPMQPTQVNKITSSCEICSGPHETQYCMENPKQSFFEYAPSHTDEAGGGDGDVMFIEIVKKNDDSRKEELEAGGLEDLEKEHTKLVYLRSGEDKKRGVEYVMSKILGFYKECLELGPEYVTGMDDEEEVM